MSSLWGCHVKQIFHYETSKLYRQLHTRHCAMKIIITIIHVDGINIDPTKVEVVWVKEQRSTRLGFNSKWPTSSGVEVMAPIDFLLDLNLNYICTKFHASSWNLKWVVYLRVASEPFCPPIDQTSTIHKSLQCLMRKFARVIEHDSPQKCNSLGEAIMIIPSMSRGSSSPDNTHWNEESWSLHKSLELECQLFWLHNGNNKLLDRWF